MRWKSLSSVHVEFPYECALEDWSTFAEVMTKNRIYHFLPERGVYSLVKIVNVNEKCMLCLVLVYS